MLGRVRTDSFSPTDNESGRAFTWRSSRNDPNPVARRAFSAPQLRTLVNPATEDAWEPNIVE